MRVLLQRVRRARVSVAGTVRGEIAAGLLLLVGVLADDTDDDALWVARKAVQLRIFDDDTGVMNRPITDVGGAMLVVSQFTLYASMRKGNRPSYSRAAPPSVAAPIFERFVAVLEATLGKPVATGTFGAQMDVELVNDGPVTLMIDSRQRE